VKHTKLGGKIKRLTYLNLHKKHDLLVVCRCACRQRAGSLQAAGCETCGAVTAPALASGGVLAEWDRGVDALSRSGGAVGAGHQKKTRV